MPAGPTPDGPLGSPIVAGRPRSRFVPALATVAVASQLLVLSPRLMAQQGSRAQSIPKFTARTELVTVPVAVLRRGSRMQQLKWSGWMDEHVTGLTKDDFQIEEDGQRKAIASFEEIRSPKPRLRTIAPPGVVTNEVISDGPVTMMILVLDMINTPYAYQDNTKKKLLEYLQNDYRGDRPTMLAELHVGGLRVLHDFTTDPQVLVRIVRRMKGDFEHDPVLDNQVQTEMSGELYKQIDIKEEYDRITTEFLGVSSAPEDNYSKWLKDTKLEITLMELQQLAHSLAAVRGMKSLVWATGGIQFHYDMRSRSSRLREEYIQTVRLLSDAGIAVYPIDTYVETVNPAYPSPASRYSPRPVFGGIQVVQNFMDIAQRTGGDYCLLRKDPELCFRKAADYDSQYYLLSYYTHSEEKARWRRIQVNVRGADLQVRARSGFFSTGANGDPEQRRKSDISQAVDTPVEYRGLPLSVRWTAPSGQAAEKARSSTEPHPGKRSFLLGIGPDTLTVDAADRNHIKLDVVAVALDPSGKVVADVTQQVNLHPDAQQLQRLRTAGLVYSNDLDVPRQATKVRFIVRDDLSERVGTVSTTIEAQP